MTQFNIFDPFVFVSLITPFILLGVIYVLFVGRNKAIDRYIIALIRKRPVVYMILVAVLMMAFLFSLINAFSLIFWNWNI